MRPNSAAAALAVVLASMATAQVATLQIQVVEGEGGVYAPGARTPRPLVVEVTDDTGRPVAGAAVSFHLPDQGPSGAFANGLRTDVVVTDDHGRATLRAMQLNRTPGQFQIRIFASKEQVTAGTVSLQYIADPASGAAAAGAGNARPAVISHSPAGPQGHGHKKWIIILAAVGAGAAAGVFATHSSGTASAASTPAGTGVTIPPAIGTPSITVGKP